MITDSDVWGGWAIDRATAIELAAFYRREQPRIVVEAGSGYSTVVAGEYARDTGATIVSLDHDRCYADRTQALLKDRGLAGAVDVRHAPLIDIQTPTGAPAPWYDTRIPDHVDFALIDGPPGRIGRRGTFYGLYPHLNENGWQVWLDDADRDGERSALMEWQLTTGVNFSHIPLPRGLATITPAADQRLTTDNLVITILTGRRPTLLSDTLRALDDAAPGLIDTADVVVCHNGGDAETRDVIDALPNVSEYLSLGGPEMVPLGEAMHRIADVLTSQYTGWCWLHMEDDWRAATTTPARWWISEATRILASFPDIGQVRLRHTGEPTHRRNLSTGQPIHWTPMTGCTNVLVSPTAHYTCNPAFMRVEDVHRVWPAPDGERGAIDRYLRTGLHVAQLCPGVFHHTGGTASLEGHPTPPPPRKRQGRGRPMGMRTPRTVDDYTRFYSAGGWTYDRAKETDVLRMMAGLAGWREGDRVHEIGSGRGEHAGILATLGYRVTAIEIAPSGTASTRKNYPNVDAVNADVATWTPDVRGHIFARGMSWFHWELDGVNSNGIDVPAETGALVGRALAPGATFVLQIWTNLSGQRHPHKVHDNSVANYNQLFEPLFESVRIYDWSGRPITPGIRHDRGVIVIARDPRRSMA